MTDTGFPPINYTDTLRLQGFISLAKMNKKILSEPDCPYDEQVKRVLRIIVKGLHADENITTVIEDDDFDVEDIFEDQDDYDVLLQQIKNSLSRLVALQHAASKESHKDRINFEKTIVTLLDKLTMINARTSDQKEVSDFKRVVMQCMETILTKDQRTQFMELLEHRT